MRAAAFDQETAMAQGIPVGRMFGLRGRSREALPPSLARS
jgi:hypothetical protein